uniref:Centrocin 2 n=1 Tax=Echinus esculentus TaxID=7648 RepID=CTCN2_ECHES|nr:RecName: Full=Centrocin 2; AltName: Full=EeCentrocin 2; Contains: RecName: Full=Centrocin 2, heavy chain; Contains: RecName: Full=Centrocin 2, light chain; Flags: Precursor [Echinus esculentus]AMT92375.1 centrocin 2 [Echinus esculentus]
MMIKIAVVLCAVMATSMVFANDVKEQELADLLDLLISEEVSSPDDAVAESWGHKLRSSWNKVKHAVKKGAGYASGACRVLGHSPQEARAKVLEAFPEMKESDLDEEQVGKYCAVAHAIHGR